MANEKEIKIISEEIPGRKDFFPEKAEFREHLNIGHPRGDTATRATVVQRDR